MTFISRLSNRTGYTPIKLQNILATCGPELIQGLMFDWSLVGRPDQQEPKGDWSTWLVLAGRGYGKTRLGSETVNTWAEDPVKLAIVGETAADARDVMVEGPSGLVETGRPWNRPKYYPSKRKLVWPSGAVAHTYSGDDPEQLRGPEQSHAYVDELGKFKKKEAWSNLQFGMRVNTGVHDRPKVLVTTTPRPIKLLKEILANPRTVISVGSTFDNAANLAPEFLAYIKEQYGGTRLGRQELYAEMLSDVPGALWTQDNIDQYREKNETPELKRIVVSIDPPITSKENSDECGIIALGLGVDDHVYVLADHSRQGLRPSGWAEIAIALYQGLHADRIVAEVNQGGDMVKSVLKNIMPTIPVKTVWASKGKYLRAEPISTLYELGKVHHVGIFPKLEDQMTQFTADFDRRVNGSPDRVDALVHGITELTGSGQQPGLVIY